MDHKFTIGDVVQHKPDGTGPYVPEVIIATAQYGDERKLGYVLRPVGRSVAVRVSTEQVDRDYDLWLSHLDR